jgi:hypothetical protein
MLWQGAADSEAHVHLFDAGEFDFDTGERIAHRGCVGSLVLCVYVCVCVCVRVRACNMI